MNCNQVEVKSLIISLGMRQILGNPLLCLEILEALEQGSICLLRAFKLHMQLSDCGVDNCIPDFFPFFLIFLRSGEHPFIKKKHGVIDSFEQTIDRGDKRAYLIQMLSG